MTEVARYFSGKSILITGGSSGIGYALAEKLRTHAAALIIVSRDRAQVDEAVRRLSGAVAAVSGYACDVGDGAQVVGMGRAVLAERGCPDIIVNNAGFAKYRTVEQSSLEEIESLANVNFIGAMRVAKVFLGAMCERRQGQIVNVASIAGGLTITPNAMYTGAKHGMLAWSRCLAYETRRFGLKVNVICPGRVETPFFDDESFKTREAGRETGLTIEMPDLIRKMLWAIASNRQVAYIPFYFGVIAWALKCAPLILEPIWAKLQVGRIERLYPSNGGRT